MTANSPRKQISISSSDAARCGLKAQGLVVVSTIDDDRHRASHVEISFRDEYLSRSDMWRLAVSELAGKVVHKGQRLAFMGTIKVTIKAIYIRGRKVPSALFSSTTKPIFRSESARYVLFIQMSKEMWDFDTDGTGEIMFDKVVNGFLPDLFKRWQRIDARHLVTIVMFTRLEVNPAQNTAPLTFGTIMTDQTSADANPPRDFYRVVVSDMPSAEWSDILVQLKREFRVFLKDVSVHTSTMTTSEGAAVIPCHIISGHPSPALHGNILEAVNLASSQFSCDYIDRDLVRTGVSVIVITPGTGVFEVDYRLLATTTDNLVDNGVGIDLVCLSRLPLHSVPLFKYRPTFQELPRQSDESPQRYKEPLDARMSRQLEEGGQADADPNYKQNGQLLSRKGGIGEFKGEGWKYGIPHWIDVSFWTSTVQTSGLSPSSLITKRQRFTTHAQSRPKSFIPRARMYELQMMGIMETSIDHIQLPYLSKFTLPRDEKYMALSSLPHARPTNSRRQSSHGDIIAQQSAGGSLQTHSSSVTSRNHFLLESQKPQYRWMDDHDELLFCHPEKRLAAVPNGQNSGVSAQSIKWKQQHDDPTTTSEAQGSTGTEESGRPSLSNPASSNKATARRTANSSAATPPSTAFLKEPRLSRRISLGFRGFGVNTSKATASTGVSVEHANPTDDPQHRASNNSSGNLTGFLKSRPTTRQTGTVEADAYLAGFSG
ncbi:MAG: hypothetical protein Q9180_006409, partial [Flavoplaca navasiana]